MPDLEFNTTAGQTIARELLIAYLNTGTEESPVWSAFGKRVEDSDEENGLEPRVSTGHSRQYLDHHEKAGHYTVI